VRWTPRTKGRGRRRAKAPPGYLSIPEFGKKYFGLERTAAYAAARRGEIPTVTIGQDWVPPNWEEILQARVLAQMEERQQEHGAKLASTSPHENPSDIPAEAPEPQARNARAAPIAPAPKRQPRRRPEISAPPS
jgi:hypothetical protein